MSTATSLLMNYSFIKLPTINSSKFLVVSVGHIFVPTAPTNLPSVPSLVFFSVTACLIMVISVSIHLPIGFTLLDMLSSMNKPFHSTNLPHLLNHLHLLYSASYHFLPLLFLNILSTRVSPPMPHVLLLLPPLPHPLPALLNTPCPMLLLPRPVLNLHVTFLPLLSLFLPPLKLSPTSPQCLTLLHLLFGPMS